MNNNKQIPIGYKITPVGIIPEDWEVKKLGDLGAFKNGINKDKEDFGHGVPFVNLNDIFNLNFADHLDLVNASLDEQKSFNLVKGDVLFVRSSVKPEGVGLTSVVKHCLKKTVYSGFIIRYRFYTNILDHNYKNYCFNEHYFRYKLLTKSTVSANTNINQKALKSLLLPIPPLAEQKAIADCLSTWDSGLNKLSALIEAKKEQKKGLMQQLFAGQEGWEIKKLGDVCERVKTKNAELNDNVVTISAKRGFVIQEEYFNKRVASETLSDYYLIQKYDFAYNKSYSNGYPMGAIKQLTILDKAVVTTLYICFRAKESHQKIYLKYYFESGKLNKALRQIAKEGGRAHGLLNIGIKDFFNIKLPIPPLSTQEHIAQVLSTADKEIDILEKKHDAMQTQKKGLMQLLLTGKKRLSI